MPREKDLKRLVRTRMQKTGESYTAARANITSRKSAKRSAPTPSAEVAPSAPEPTEAASSAAPPTDKPDYATLAVMSDETLQAKTGCDWSRWVFALDQRKAYELSHREIADIVHTKYDVPGWWAQAVTVGYERIKGLRERGQRRGGGFEASKSKTFDVPVEVLFDAWAHKRTRRRWLGDPDPEVRTATKPRSMRLGLGDGTVVALWFTAKGESKSAVSVQHLDLPDREAAERSKRDWQERLKALAGVLAPKRPRA